MVVAWPCCCGSGSSKGARDRPSPPHQPTYTHLLLATSSLLISYPLYCLRREGYRDAYLTAHFEVPGEMFTLAMDARRSRGMGVVGSTQNILDFISAK